MQGLLRSLGVFGRCSISLCLLVFVACVGHVRSYPLYPNPQVQRDPAKIARLTGIVATVDGVDVTAKGNTFDLAPGCHVVTLVRTIGQGGEHEPWSVDVPRWVYAFKMTGGHIYAIEHRVQLASNQNGTVAISALERDGSGAVFGPVAPSRGRQDIEECKEWERAQQPVP
jgi:hypothetical protein